MSPKFNSQNQNQVRNTKFIVACSLIAVLASACSAAPSSAPAAPAAAPAAEAPKAEQRPIVRSYDSNGAAPQATQAPAAEAPKPTESPKAEAAAPAAGAPAAAPRPITPQQEEAKPGQPRQIDNGRAPIEPTSVAPQPAPVDNTFRDYGVNPFVDAYRDHLSTFALDVDTASYAVSRNYINGGSLPPYEAVRAEEFINYFQQDYTPPTNGAFAIYADGAISPFHQDGTHLIRVGVQGYVVSERQRKPSVLTFVIDESGSMEQGARMEQVKQSLQMLVDRLGPDDSVAIVAFSDSARVVLNTTRGNDRNRILDAIYTLRPTNGTNTESGLRLGYDLANQFFRPEANNRLVLATDGVANQGVTDPEQILAGLGSWVRRDIYLTAIGFGQGNFNDDFLQRLADKGNGHYVYVDTIEEAHKQMVDNVVSTLQVIAKDAKVQVDFNGDVVQEYRLIGYEKRAIADADFRNDSVDAGEMGAGHNTTALYQVKLRANARGKIATVNLRWQDPDNGQVNEISGDIGTGDIAGDYTQASPRYQMNAVVAEFAEILRKSPYSTIGLGQLAREAQRMARLLPRDNDVQEFAQLVAQASRFAQ